MALAFQVSFNVRFWLTTVTGTDAAALQIGGRHQAVGDRDAVAGEHRGTDQAQRDSNAGGRKQAAA